MAKEIHSGEDKRESQVPSSNQVSLPNTSSEIPTTYPVSLSVQSGTPSTPPSELASADQEIEQSTDEESLHIPHQHPIQSSESAQDHATSSESASSPPSSIEGGRGVKVSHLALHSRVEEQEMPAVLSIGSAIAVQDQSALPASVVEVKIPHSRIDRVNMEYEGKISREIRKVCAKFSNFYRDSLTFDPYAEDERPGNKQHVIEVRDELRELINKEGCHEIAREYLKSCNSSPCYLMYYGLYPDLAMQDPDIACEVKYHDHYSLGGFGDDIFDTIEG